MRIERLNNCVFWTCLLCFILQSIGYLSPGWFVREVSLKQIVFSADGRNFELPWMSSEDSYDNMGLGLTTVGPTKYPMHTDRPRRTTRVSRRPMTTRPANTKPPPPSRRPTRVTRPPPSGRPNRTSRPPPSGRPNRTTVRPPPTWRPNGNGTMRPRPSGRPTRTTVRPRPSGRPTRTTVRVKRTRPTTPPTPRSDGAMQGSGRQRRDTGPSKTSNSNKGPPISTTAERNPNKGGMTNNNEKDQPNDTTNDKARVPNNDMDSNDTKDPMKDKFNNDARDPIINVNGRGNRTSLKKRMNGTPSLVHMTMGLWYGRACINSRTVMNKMGKQPGTEWCTLYARTNTSMTEKKGRLFELRMEASFGIAFSVISVVLAGMTCCYKHHAKIRLAASVGAMFLSGAVMAIPVVHVIVTHVNMHSEMVRKRNWGNMFINTHEQHDLFDHWSVILCGVASILSTISTFVFAVLACRSDMQPRNRYDVGKMELSENSEKRNLKLSMIGNGKVTLPPETTFTEYSKADTAGDRDSACVITDSTAASATDGGDSMSTDSFDNVKEMTSFNDESVDEIGHYVEIEDADEKSEASE